MFCAGGLPSTYAMQGVRGVVGKGRLRRRNCDAECLGAILFWGVFLGGCGVGQSVTRLDFHADDLSLNTMVAYSFFCQICV